MFDLSGLPIRLGGRLVVDDVNLTVAPGQIVGLIGDSGSGKTRTVLDLLRTCPSGLGPRCSWCWPAVPRLPTVTA